MCLTKNSSHHAKASALFGSLLALAFLVSSPAQGSREPATPAGGNNYPQCPPSMCNGEFPPLTTVWPDGANCQCSFTEGPPVPPAPIECNFDFGVPDSYEAPIRYEPPRSAGGVSLSTGELVIDATDLSVFDTGGTITFSRTYRSAIDYKRTLGPRWFHNWGEQVLVGSSPAHPEVCGQLARWVREDGSFIEFQIQQDGQVFNPPESDFKMRKLPFPLDGYEVRHVGDTVRRFVASADADVYDIQSLTSGSQSLTFHYDNGRLTELRNDDQPRLNFHYHWNGLLSRVENALDPENDWVSFQYNSCGNLSGVRRPLTRLSDNPDHSPSSTFQPTTEYSYVNLNAGSCSSTAHGQHLITDVKVSQYDPLSGSAIATESRLTTRYYGSIGSPPSLFGKVAYQCFADPICSTGDLEYDYFLTSRADVIDNRVGGRITRYHLAGGLVTKLIEDHGGLERETSYSYSGGVQTSATFADGRCEETSYTTVNDVQLPETTRLRTAAQCGQPPHDSDIVTHRVYEPFGGRPRSVTGPGAFPDGIVPPDFDATQLPWVKHTTFFYYDYDEGGVGSSHCDDWGINCPTGPATDWNAYSADDGNSFGNIVLTRQYNPVNDLWLDTRQIYTSHGRPLQRTNPDETFAKYQYFDDGENPSLWSLTSSRSDAGAGPLASRQEFPSTGPGLPATEYEWSARNRVVKIRGGTGVISSRSLAENGNLLSETVCVGECAAAADILRKTLYTYDLRGRPLWERVEDSGAASLFERSAAFDVLDRLESTTVDPGGLSLTTGYFYDGIGRRIKTVSPEGRAVCVYYDSLDRVVESRRDADAECDGVPDTDDISTTIAYDAMDRPVITTDGEGVSTYNWYDEHGRPEFVSDGKPESPADVFGTVVFLESPPPLLPTESDWWAETRYDESSRPIRSRFYGRDEASSTGVPGFLQASWTEYDELGRATDSRLAVSQQGPFVSQPDWTATVPTEISNDTDVSSTATTYDVEGRVQKTTDVGGRVTDYEYDVFGRLERVLEPVYGTCSGDPEKSCASDTVCTGTCSLNPRDEVKILFDSFGRPYRSERKTHDHDGTPHTVVAETDYDAWGRVSRTTGDPGTEDLITEFVYDPLGRAEWQTRRWDVSGTPNGQDQAVNRTYDRAGRLTHVHVRESLDDPGPPATFDVSTTSFIYDGDGLTTSMTDAMQNTTDYVYTAGLGQLEKMQYPMDGGARQTVAYPLYNGRGQPKRIEFQEDDSSSAMRVAWTLAYDDRGRLTQRTGALEEKVGYCEDNPAQTCTPTQSCPAPWVGPCVFPEFSGTTRQDFAYDDLGRVVKAIDHSPGFTSNEDITVHRAYNSLGQLRTSTQMIPRNGSPVSHVVESLYELDGFRSRLIYPDAYNQITPPEQLKSHWIEYKQDVKGRLETIVGRVDPDAPLVSDPWPNRDLARYRYSGGRMTSRWYGNETELHVATDSLGRVTQFRTSPQTGSDVADFLYGHDRVGNLIYEQRAHEPFTTPSGHFRTRIYANDAMGRMTNRSEGPATATDPLTLASSDDSETWDLDLVGNWESRISSSGTHTFTDNSLNQYTQVADGSVDQFVHDWLGQLREDEPHGQKYVWDLFGRLTKVLFETGTLKARYRYDPFNRRVERHVPAPGGSVADADTWFIYDGWRAIEERALWGTPVVEIVRARYGFGNGLDEVLWMDRDVDTNGTVESRYFVHQDMRGSAVAATDDPSNPDNVDVVERYTYSEYGVAKIWINENADWNGSGYPGTGQCYSDIGLPYLYTGQRYDWESGLSYFKNRYYDAGNGRFLRRDLIGYMDGSALYAYARSNPASNSDPLGLASQEFLSMRASYAAYMNSKRIEGRDAADNARAMWRNRVQSIQRDDPNNPGGEVDLDEVDRSRCPSVNACKNPSVYGYMLASFGILTREYSPREYLNHARRNVSPNATRKASYGGVWTVFRSLTEARGFDYAVSGSFYDARRFMAMVGGRTYDVGTSPTAFREGMQFFAYDDHDPFLGSHALETVMAIPGLRLVKWLNKIKRLAKAAEAARGGGKVFSEGKQALVDMAKRDQRTGISPDDMQAYKDLNAQLPDPFPANAVRGPEAHMRGGPHSQQPHGHVGPVDHIPIIEPPPVP